MPRAQTALPVLLVMLCACGEGFETTEPPGPSANGWSKSFGDNAEQTVTSAAVDAAGNVYITGGFYGFTDFGNGSLEAAEQSEDLFIAKYDTDGDLLWARRFGDESNQRGSAVAVGSNGHVVVVGSFGGSMEFAGQFVAASDQSDAFVVVVSAEDGTDVWAQSFQGQGFDQPRSVSVDRGGNIVIGGDFDTDITVRGSDNMGDTFNAVGESDMFVVKLLDNGGFVWARQFGDVASDQLTDTATDSSGVIALTGYIRGGVVDFGGGPLDPVGIDPNDDAFIVSLGPDGGHRWSKRLGDEFYQRGSGVAYDADDQLLALGEFSSLIDFDGEQRTSSGNLDTYLVKLADDGSPVWARSFGVTSNSYARRVGADPDRNVFLTGDFEGVVDFGGSQLTSEGERDVYYARLDSSASHSLSMSFGDIISQSAYDIAVDRGGNAIIVGNFYGSIDFGFGVHSSADATDLNPFVAKLVVD